MVNGALVEREGNGNQTNGEDYLGPDEINSEQLANECWREGNLEGFRFRARGVVSAVQGSAGAVTLWADFGAY